jgi:hypothetical protein
MPKMVVSPESVCIVLHESLDDWTQLRFVSDWAAETKAPFFS